MSIKLAVFDLDGVLVDSRLANAEAFAYGIERLGLPRPSEERVVGLIGKSAASMLEALGCPASEIGRCYDSWVKPRYLECIAEMAREMPGARSLLEQLRSCGVKIGACTSGSRAIQEPVLRALGLWEYFQAVQTPCASRFGKPQPEYLGELVARFDRVGQVVHVEDTEEGCLMGRRWGATTVFAEYGYGCWEGPDQPDHRIRQLSELEPILLC